MNTPDKAPSAPVSPPGQSQATPLSRTADPTPEASAGTATGAFGGLRVLDFDQLAGPHNEVLIRLGTTLYRLRRTRNDRLLLYK